ncbi:MAG: ATP-dependent DNA helicase [Candidatus Wolfebacteria bacterium GW2011_GWC1_43_10]|nr:MAG: ATP-dependent DNA helicase [Candidatus Wolfebacteria bacterium GW2011_GWC1_43_10]KKT22139.1 MAG: ATP-dependent DNA helicase [Parcubacteria group bacterium GW2011_GWB1_43_8b]
MLPFSTPLTEIKGIGPRIADKLAKLKLRTVKDVLYYFPFRYQDFSKISKIADLSEEQIATIYGKIEKVSIYRTPRRHMWIVEATITDETGKIKAVWFNQKFLINTLKEGKTANFAGKTTADGKKLSLQNPMFEMLSDEFQETRHTGRLVPIYSQTTGITSKMIRFVLSRVIPLFEDAPEFLPEDTVEKFQFPPLARAFTDIHFPKNLEGAQKAERRFSFQDLFLLQLINASEKYSLSQQKSYSCDYSPEFIKEIFSFLPFELTLSQKKALYEILEDLKKSYPTSRLLQGDVGSGKTIVAAIAALVAAKNQKQSVFMAPTEILAKQHYETFKKFFEEFSDGVALLTSSQSVAFYGNSLETETSKKELVSQIKNGKIKIVIGTHSVIQKYISFKNPAFVVIDEQHRFGVRQRAELVHSTEFIPHLLSMSATPIPRTLALSAFGDLDLSIINELPKNRKPIVTKAVSSANRQKAYDFIAKHIRAGRQAFVICPRIEPPDPEAPLTPRQLFQLEVKSVKEEYEKLSKKIFPQFKIALLHGRMKSTEKQKTMQDFKDKKYDILVSTSVVEVGVDVPNATIMMIEGSEHFGLSQLYQFRGRVGRGEYQSFCFLFSDINSRSTADRMRALVNAKNGFELAEIDLRLRGPGQFLGQEQAGMPDLAMKAIQNPELVKVARETAHDIIQKDPQLKKHPYLAAYVKTFKEEVHLE